MTEFRLESYISFNPPRTAILKFVSAALESFLHRRRNPELHGPAHESSVESLWRDSDDGVRHIVEALHLANDFRVTFEAILPELIADDHDRMGIVACILTRFEATPENRVHAGGIEIVGGDDASARGLCALSDTQRATGNLTDERVLAERAVPAQVEEVRPRKQLPDYSLSVLLRQLRTAAPDVRLRGMDGIRSLRPN